MLFRPHILLALNFYYSKLTSPVTSPPLFPSSTSSLHKWMLPFPLKNWISEGGVSPTASHCAPGAWGTNPGPACKADLLTSPIFYFQMANKHKGVQYHHIKEIKIRSLHTAKIRLTITWEHCQ